MLRDEDIEGSENAQEEREWMMEDNLNRDPWTEVKK